MKLVTDTHVHTIASGHAYSTIKEYIDIAEEKGIELIAFTDHTPSMQGGPDPFHFGNLRILPRKVNGVTILRGAEADIVDFDGNLGMEDYYLKHLDFVIASFHDVVLKPGSKEENTRAFIGAMKNPYVNAIGHAGNPQVPVDLEALVIAAKENDVVFEINNSSFTSKSRHGSEENCNELAKLCVKHGVKMLSSSDSHICYNLGNFDHAYEVFEKQNVPEELILSTSVDKLIKHLKEHGRELVGLE